MSLVSSDMINVSIDPRRSVTLADLLSGKSSHTVPISLFGSPVSAKLIETSVSYMMNLGGGEISVPVPEGYALNLFPNFLVRVQKNNTGDMYTVYEMYSYRPPVGSEERPYGGEWVTGDIVHNYDLQSSDDRCLGWICTTSGVPGTWEPFGALGKIDIKGSIQAFVTDGILEISINPDSSTD